MPGPNNRTTHKKKKQQFLAAISTATTVASSQPTPAPLSRANTPEPTAQSTNSPPPSPLPFGSLSEEDDDSIHTEAFRECFQEALELLRSQAGSPVLVMERIVKLAYSRGVRTTYNALKDLGEEYGQQQYRKGREDERLGFRDEMNDEWLRGRQFGLEEAEEYAQAARDARIEVGTMTEPTSTLNHVDSSTQTDIPPSSAHEAASPVSVDWAAECESIPIQSMFPAPLPPPRRDLSVLRSHPPQTHADPFKSLQRRTTHHRHQCHRLRHPYSHPLSFSHTPSTTSRRPSYVIPQRRIHRANDPLMIFRSQPLDWIDDPRLRELSRCLRSLGWTRA